MLAFYRNPFPHEKILDETKLKAFADDKCNKNDNFVFDRVQNIVEKGEIACTSIFSFSPQSFQKASLANLSKGVKRNGLRVPLAFNRRNIL